MKKDDIRRNEFYEWSIEENNDVECVGEASPAYAAGKMGIWIPVQNFSYRKQGEFTLEDYYAVPEDIRVELIDGTFYAMGAPSFLHQKIIGEICYQISSYIRNRKGKCEVMQSPLDVQLDRDNKTMVQPDLLIICDKDKIQKRVIFGAPDFVLEVLSPGTFRKDITIKLEKYKNAGVREYWILDPKNEKLIVNLFENQEKSSVHELTEHVGVGIYDGELQIDLLPGLEAIREYS